MMFTVSFNSACSDSDGGSDIPFLGIGDGNDDGDDDDNNSVEPGVYIAGTNSDGSDSYAGYWKDEAWIGFGDPETNGGDLNITVSDIYVTGVDYTTGYSSPTACYWKNGVYNSLNSTGFTSLLYATDTSIYIAGSQGYSPSNAGYWKDGTRIDLELGTASFAEDIFLNGSDVYVIGTYSITQYVPCYWKNGTRHDLPTTTDGNYVRSGTRDGDNYYIPGYDGYWILDLTDDSVSPFNPLTNAMQYDGIMDIHIEGGTVYAVGNSTSGGALWVDGTIYTIDAPSKPYAITVSGDDIYVVGESGSKAYYWIINKLDTTDIEPKELSTETGTSASDIIIVE